MEKIFKKAIKIIVNTSKVYYKQTFEEYVDGYKFEDDNVTNRDVETQKVLVEKLSKLISGSGFIAEEKLNSEKDKEYVWIIDPIDGTINYKNDFAIYGTQVALRYKNKIIFSCIYMPCLNELYYSYNGKSYLNGKKLNMLKPKTGKNIVFDFRLFKSKNIFLKPDFVHGELLKNKNLRIIGCTSYEFAMLATGKMDVIVKYDITEWDFYPGWFLASNVGAKIKKFPKYNFIIIASDQELLDKISDDIMKGKPEKKASPKKVQNTKKS